MDVKEEYEEVEETARRRQKRWEENYVVVL